MHALEPSRLRLAPSHCFSFFSCPCIFTYLTWNSQWSPYPLTFRCGVNVKRTSLALLAQWEVCISQTDAKEKKNALWHGIQRNNRLGGQVLCPLSNICSQVSSAPTWWPEPTVGRVVTDKPLLPPSRTMVCLGDSCHQDLQWRNWEELKWTAEEACPTPQPSLVHCTHPLVKAELWGDNVISPQSLLSGTVNLSFVSFNLRELQ